LNERVIGGPNFPSVTLDQYIAQGNAAPSVMKIDVDGFELHVLRGARKCLAEHRPRLWVEVHPEFLRAQGKSHEQVGEFLRQAGYTLEFFKDRHSVHWEKSFHVWCV